MKKLTVTIGICAYNEENNISKLLKSIFDQYVENFTLEKIVVVSDGSTDFTVNKLKSTNSKVVKIIEHQQRGGKSLRLNEIYKELKSDVLVQLDADVILENRYVISRLVKPFLMDRTVGMTSGSGKPFPAKTFVEKAVQVTRETYKPLSRRIRDGNNKMSVNGRIMAVRKNILKKINIPQDVIGNDAFVYFKCIQLGYKFVSVESARVKFYLPRSLNDHIKQNTRFIAVPAKMAKYYPTKLVESENYIPKYLLAYYMLLQVIKNPILSIYIFIINRYCQIKAMVFASKLTGKWDISISTKNYHNALKN